MTNPLRPKFATPGRAASDNPDVRYDRFRTEAVDDGWGDHDPLPVLRTTVTQERPRKVITRNTSPDLSFDRSINPYRGCEHGCIYCFARPSHAYLGLSPGLDFETRLIARPDAPEVLAKELRAKSYQARTIAIGTNTDPYQPIERDRGIMRAILKVLSDFNHPVAIVTKGTLIARDRDILAPMSAKGLVRVGISVTTLDPKTSRAMEPRVPSPAARLRVIEQLIGCSATNRSTVVGEAEIVVNSDLTDAIKNPLLHAGEDSIRQSQIPVEGVLSKAPFGLPVQL